MIGHTIRHFWNPSLGHGYFLCDILTRHMRQDKRVHKGSTQLDLRCHFHNFKSIMLISTHRFAKDRALFTVFDGHIEHSLSHAL